MFNCVPVSYHQALFVQFGGGSFTVSKVATCLGVNPNRLEVTERVLTLHLKQ